MTKKVSSKRIREDLRPRPFPVARGLLPFADRIKLCANEPVGPEQLNAVEVMADILAKKKLPSSEASGAILEARNAARNHQLTPWRSENRLANVKDFNDLVSRMKELAKALAILSLTEKGHLNRNTAHLVNARFFDTEVFFELINLLQDLLLDLSPSRNADDARRIIERREGESSPQISRLWESIPAITRNRVERRIEQRTKRSRSLSCVELLRALPKLLWKFRPTRRGAPRFLLRKYVEDIDRIWLRLNLTGRRQYNGVTERHMQSFFQKFCNAALTSVGDSTKISIRQVSDLKRRRPPKRKKRSKPRSSS